MRTLSGRAALILALSALHAVAVRAQLEIPAIAMYGATDSTLAITPGEAKESIGFVWERAERRIPVGRADFPKDSIQALASADARSWLARLERQSVGGIQTEPYASVQAAAGGDTIAERVIAKRLATPGLSDADRSYTLLAAVQVFADPAVPARLPVAEGYLTRLNAMGRAAAVRRYLAEIALVKAYDDLGRSADVARHGIAAIHLVPLLGMRDCEPLQDARRSPYPTIVRAVVVQPGGAAAVAEMNGILARRVIPPSDSVAIDSAFYVASKEVKRTNAAMLETLARVGEYGGPIVSNRWLNRPDSTPGAMPVSDGKVRVIISMDQGCIGCVIAALHLQALADADSSVHPVMVTWTDNSWSNRVITSDESAAFLTNFWIDQKKLRYPIALWIVQKKDTLSDGSVMDDLGDDPSAVRYPETGQPQYYILDGQGRIRAAFFGAGGSDPVVERQIVEIVHHLNLESAHSETRSATAS